MQTLFLKRKCISMESLYDIAYDEKEEVSAEIASSTSDGEIDPYIRSTVLKVLDPVHYPDVCKGLLSLIPTWSSHHDNLAHATEDDYIIGELHYLRYGTGDHFARHQDAGIGGTGGRVFSSSTIITMTEDLRGGDFRMWDNDNGCHALDLEPGDTLFFDSKTRHEITKVLSGTREVLVAWIYKR